MFIKYILIRLIQLFKIFFKYFTSKTESFLEKLHMKKLNSILVMTQKAFFINPINLK